MVAFDENWILGNAKCISQYENMTEPAYCRAVWDRYLCWPPTPPGQVASLRCPQSKGIDTSQFATRTCRSDGIWQRKDPIREDDAGSINIRSNDSILSYGWTNYSQCFPPGIRELLAILNSQSEYEAERKLMAAEGTRILEMIGLIVSLVSLFISLLIFYRFRNLRNNRTRIHGNLFIATCIQVLVRIIVYSDQYISRSASADRKGIEDSEYVCELFYILLEYARTSMFLWMFVEGLYLHNMITVAVFQERINAWFFYCIGWGVPVILTVIWAAVTFDKFHGITCWWGYNLSPYFWILEGPRLTVIVLNLIFLLNIMRVLVTKLRETNSSEALQVRKAVRAAIILLPLLGITNSLQMVHSPVDKDAIQFAIWSYLTAFLTSFQGFFCALIYCFLNGEVQLSVRRCLKARKHRKDRQAKFGIGQSLKIRNTNTETNKVARLFKAETLGQNNGSYPGQSKRPSRVNESLQEYWNEAELSSHNNVDVENIEIPNDYFAKHGGRINQSRCERLNIVKLYSPTTSFTISPVSNRGNDDGVLKETHPCHSGSPDMSEALELEIIHV